MKNITDYIIEGKLAKKAINTTISEYVTWWTGAADAKDVIDGDYYDDLKDGAKGMGMWVFGEKAVKSQFGGSFDNMYKFIISEMKKNTAITLIQSELGAENTAIYFTLGDYVFDTTATGEFDGK